MTDKNIIASDDKPDEFVSPTDDHAAPPRADSAAAETEQTDGAPSAEPQTAQEPVDKPKKPRKTAKQWFKDAAHRYFIDAFSGMALGLFCTLIIGTIIGQIGDLIGNNPFGLILHYIGLTAKQLMGAGIGVGMAFSLKSKKLTGFSAAVAGTVGANITNIFALSGVNIYGASANPSITIGDPVGAYVGAVFAIEIADLVEGKTPVDIIVVPLTAIVCGTLGAIALGIPFGILFALIGKGVSMAIAWEPISFGILVSVLMGLFLTLPTSSAAFGVMIFNSSLINTPQLTYNAQIGAAAACAGWWVVCAVLLAVTAAWCAALLGAAASAAEGGPAVRSRFRVKNFTVS